MSGTLLGVNGVVRGFKPEMSGAQAAQPVAQDPEGLEQSQPKRNHFGGLVFFPQGVRPKIHVLAGVRKHRGESVTNGHRHLMPHKRKHPMKIAKVAPLGIKENAAFMNHFSPDKYAAGQDRETEPDMLRTRHQ